MTSPSTTVSPTTSAPGGSVAAAWSEIRAPGATGWLGLFTRGSPETAYLAWR